MQDIARKLANLITPEADGRSPLSKALSMQSIAKNWDEFDAARTRQEAEAAIKDQVQTHQDAAKYMRERAADAKAQGDTRAAEIHTEAARAHKEAAAATKLASHADPVSTAQARRLSAKAFEAERKSDDEVFGKSLAKADQTQTFIPPKGVQEEAARAVAWIKDGKAGDGMTAVGRKRASDLAAGRPISLDTIHRMNQFLNSHKSDESAEGWEPGEDGYPSAGRVAFAAWGGDPAISWVNSIIESAEKADSNSFTPPKGVQEEAQRAVEWIKDGHAGQGFTAVGRGRAGDLAAGKPQSLDIIKRMASYLARHEVDKKGQGWNPGEDGYPSAGRVAWAAWGGDPAVSWTSGILDSIKD